MPPYVTLFDLFLNPHRYSTARVERTKVPRDIWEDEESGAITLVYAVAGFSKEDIKVTLNSGVLHVEVEKAKLLPNGVKRLVSEIKCSGFVDKARIPTDKYEVSKDKVTVKVKDGLLRITFPLKEEAKPVELSIE